MKNIFYLTFIYFLISESKCNESNLIELYESGVKAYDSNDFHSCVDLLEQSLHYFKEYYNRITYCRGYCSSNTYQSLVDYDSDYLTDLSKILQVNFCYLKCLDGSIRDVDMPPVFQLNEYYKYIFTSHKIYEYLQICYYRLDDINEAASATFTVLLKTPDDEAIKSNLNYLSKEPNYNPDKIRDRLEKKYISYYLAGTSAYNNRNFKECIKNMEASVIYYLEENKQCRSFCEGEFTNNPLADFYTSISDRLTDILTCKQECDMAMNFIKTEYYHDMLANHYEFLNYCYFNGWF